MSRLLNDGSNAPPVLRIYLSLANLNGLRADSVWPAGLAGDARDARLAADGFEGVQITTDAPPAVGATLPHCGVARINTPGEADAIVARHVDRGDECVTVHIGWSIEDDLVVDRLVEATLSASDRHRMPFFVETHRGTITQDVWRTARIVQRFPETHFNGDFSHYYCGQELVYGDWAARLDFMQPIFDRVGFMHGRVASPGCIQMPVGDGSKRPAAACGLIDYLAHFRELWTRDGGIP